MYIPMRHLESLLTFTRKHNLLIAACYGLYGHGGHKELWKPDLLSNSKHWTLLDIHPVISKLCLRWANPTTDRNFINRKFNYHKKDNCSFTSWHTLHTLYALKLIQIKCMWPSKPMDLLCMCINMYRSIHMSLATAISLYIYLYM